VPSRQGIAVVDHQQDCFMGCSFLGSGGLDGREFPNIYISLPAETAQALGVFASGSLRVLITVGRDCWDCSTV
jgi:hypothetical protein